MNLISCDSCAVILDKDKLHFAEDIYDDNGSVNDNVAAYNSYSRCYEAFVKCPVCEEPIYRGS